MKIENMNNLVVVIWLFEEKFQHPWQKLWNDAYYSIVWLEAAYFCERHLTNHTRCPTFVQKAAVAARHGFGTCGETRMNDSGSMMLTRTQIVLNFDHNVLFSAPLDSGSN